MDSIKSVDYRESDEVSRKDICTWRLEPSEDSHAQTEAQDSSEVYWLGLVESL